MSSILKNKSRHGRFCTIVCNNFNKCAIFIVTVWQNYWTHCFPFIFFEFSVENKWHWRLMFKGQTCGSWQLLSCGDFQNVEDVESRYSKERNWLRFRQLSKCIREAGSLEPGTVRFCHSVKYWVSVTRHFSQSLLSTSVPLGFGSCFCSQFLQGLLYDCSRVIYLICVTSSYPHSFQW